MNLFSCVQKSLSGQFIKKWRECIFSNEIPKSFWGPKVGPRPHAEKGSFHSHDAAAHRRQFRPVMIWGPPRSNPGSAPDRGFPGEDLKQLYYHKVA